MDRCLLDIIDYSHRYQLDLNQSPPIRVHCFTTEQQFLIFNSLDQVELSVFD